MAKAFPSDNPFLHGYYGPVNTEADAGHLHITGEMPRELLGTLYRNGPNPQFAPRGPYHWFGGDGMIHAFHIENGNVCYRNRWVRTPKWELENKEGEGLSGTFGNPRYSDPRIFEMNSTIANTNIVWHGGKLLALEEAHAPFCSIPRASCRSMVVTKPSATSSAGRSPPIPSSIPRPARWCSSVTRPRDASPRR